MQNPYDRPVPSNDQPKLRVQEYARDLAYGAIVGWWNSELPVGVPTGHPLWKLHHEKWAGVAIPTWDLLVSFGYLNRLGGHGTMNYILTTKAFDLLETIAPNTTVFISYGRKMSSALALAVQYRLSFLGVKAFLDRDLELGDDWHARLEQKIRDSDFFVSILAPGVLHSENLRKEIQWAHESRRLCIPIWHSGFSGTEVESRSDMSDEVKKYVSGKNAYRVTDESPLAYHDAIEGIISRLM